MNYFDLVLRWIHILSAASLVGGTFFLHFVWWPAHRHEDEAEREASFTAIRPAWSLCVSTTSALLLVSGLINAVTMILRFEFEGVIYERVLVTLKLLLALAFFYVAARLSGRSRSAIQARTRMKLWLRGNTLLAVALVALAGYMKMVPRQAKSAVVPAATTGKVAGEQERPQRLAQEARPRAVATRRPVEDGGSSAAWPTAESWHAGTDG